MREREIDYWKEGNDLTRATAWLLFRIQAPADKGEVLSPLPVLCL